MERKLAAVILAAGKGTRMKSSKNKLLHKILGREVIRFPVEAAKGVGAEPLIVVAGPHNINGFKKIFPKGINFALQKKALGTAHALWQAEEFLKGFSGDLLVLVGDSPYVNADILKMLVQHHRETSSSLTLVSSVFQEPPPYGRVVRDEKGWVVKVVEETDATEEELKIREVNSSYYAFRWEEVQPLIHQIKENPKKGEFYLTDIVELAYRKGLKTSALRIDDPLLTKGINTREDLAEASEYFNRRNIQALLEAGVSFVSRENVVVEFDVHVGRDTVIYPFTYLGAGTFVGKNCEVGPFAYLKGVRVEDGWKLSFVKMVSEDD